MPRLRTVRAKLTALVALSALVTLAVLPLLSWFMHRQLIDEVDDRVPSAEHGLEIEIDDDLRDLKAAIAQLSTRRMSIEAIEKRDPKLAGDSARALFEAYPGTDYAFFDADGKLVGQLGCASPIQKLPDDVLAVVKTGGVYMGIVDRGCEALANAPPAFMVARQATGGVGYVLGCMPFDLDWVHNARDKLGVELAFVDTSGKLVVASSEFPSDHVTDARREPSLLDRGSQMWALGRASPGAFATPAGNYTVPVALDVTDIRDIVRQNLYISMGVLVLAALFSVVLGARLATIMGTALGRVNFALRKLEQHQYTKVDTLKTGDELEDLANGFNTMVDGLRERDKLKNTFGKYMTQTVMEHLLSGKVHLGGETLKVTILFSDIRSFTSISEKMDAHELVALLNEYFTEMVGIIMEQDGVVDKYIGDAIMAVFGAPVSKPDDAVRAVRAAIKMRAALAELNVKLKERGIPELKTGIGLHTGEVVAGNIGSEKRMEYTVIGDAVNLASRLEGVTKDMGVNVLISEDTYQLVKDTCKTKQMREITVKGRVQPVMTYSVLSDEGEDA